MGPRYVPCFLLAVSNIYVLPDSIHLPSIEPLGSLSASKHAAPTSNTRIIRLATASSSKRKVHDFPLVRSPPQLPVLPPNKEPVQTARQETHHGDSQADGVALGVPRRIGDQEGKCRDDATDVAEADHPRCADAAVRVAVKVHHEPAQGDRPAGERPHRDEMDSPVLGREGMVDGYENGEAGDRECDAERDVRGAELRAVGEVGEYDG